MNEFTPWTALVRAAYWLGRVEDDDPVEDRNAHIVEFDRWLAGVWDEAYAHGLSDGQRADGYVTENPYER